MRGGAGKEVVQLMCSPSTGSYAMVGHALHVCDLGNLNEENRSGPWR